MKNEEIPLKCRQNVLALEESSSIPIGLKMKFLILALSTLAVASASLFGGKSFNVLDDGTMVIRTETGKQIMISKKLGPLGQNVMEIDVSGPFSAGKKIQIDENNVVKVSPATGTLDMNTADLMDRLKRSPKVTTPAPTQADILAEIVKEFQGLINEAGYEKFLAKLQKNVTKGKIDQSIVDYVQTLAEDMPWHTVPTTTAPAVNAQVKPTMWQANQLPLSMCNDITCFKQMMMMNGINQKAPLMPYDQYMKMNAYNSMRFNPWSYYGQIYPSYPVHGYPGYPVDNGLVSDDLAARKNFWSTYMSKLNMNSFGKQSDEQQQLPVNKDVVDNKLFF